MRVENVKGAVWTVDELEFYKRRPQRCTGGGGGSGSSGGSSSSTSHQQQQTAAVATLIGAAAEASGVGYVEHIFSCLVFENDFFLLFSSRNFYHIFRKSFVINIIKIVFLYFSFFFSLP
jgi:hypothetical protein